MSSPLTVGGEAAIKDGRSTIEERRSCENSNPRCSGAPRRDGATASRRRHAVRNQHAVLCKRLRDRLLRYRSLVEVLQKRAGVHLLYRRHVALSLLDVFGRGGPVSPRPFV